MTARALSMIVLGITLALGATGCPHPGDIETDRPVEGGGGSTGTETTNAATSNLMVVNNSGTTIYYLYVSPSTSSSWGSDQLGSRVVSPGQSFTLGSIPCGINYDLRAEGSGHSGLAQRFGVYFACGSTITWTFSS